MPASLDNAARFTPVGTRGSPLRLAPVILNSEAYMTLRKEPR